MPNSVALPSPTPPLQPFQNVQPVQNIQDLTRQVSNVTIHTPSPPQQQPQQRPRRPVVSTEPNTAASNNIDVGTVPTLKYNQGKFMNAQCSK